MAIQTYDDLIANVAGWLNRGDIAAVIPTFVSLFEAQFNKDPRGRIQKSVVISSANIANELSPVPSNYIQMQNLRIPGSQSNPDGLDLLTSQQVGQFRARYNVAGEPLYYAIIGTQLRLLPIPDQQYTFEMEYFSKLPALSASNETNWLLADHPDIYLYGSLLQAEPYLKNDERIPVWRGLYDSAMEALNTTDDRTDEMILLGNRILEQVHREYPNAYVGF